MVAPTASTAATPSRVSAARSVLRSRSANAVNTSRSQRPGRLRDGGTGADIAAVVRKAGRLALRADMAAEKISQKDFLAALQEIGPSVTPDTMKHYAWLGKELRKKASREVERGLA